MPNLNKSITPQEFMPFEWEVEAKKTATEKVDFNKLESVFEND